MSSKYSSGDGVSKPDDILSSYLDDLLGGGDLLGDALTALDTRVSDSSAPIAANSVSARVVSLPTKKPADKSLNEKLSAADRYTEAAKPQLITRPRASFGEPEVIQTHEQKLKLEKLLQSARIQLLEEPAVAVETIATTKTAFVENPHEIQDWVVATEELPVALANPEIEQTPLVQDATIETRQPRSFQLPGLDWLDNGQPQWAQSRFDVLLFQVSGLTLAVPLISLGQIQPLTDELTPLFGQADWFMGLQPTPAGKIRTVNTAKFVMPERYDDSFLETAKYVVSIDGVPWGLAVDSVNQPISLNPEDVKWRGDRSKRPWLAGTVKDHMCALLDIPRIGQMLIDADKNFALSR